MAAIRFRAVDILFYFVLLEVLYIGNDAAEDGIKLTKSDGTGEMPEETEGMIRLNPPTMDDEEQNSPHMPHALRCDGCRAIAYQVGVNFMFVYLIK